MKKFCMSCGSTNEYRSTKCANCGQTFGSDLDVSVEKVDVPFRVSISSDNKVVNLKDLIKDAK